MENKTFVYDKSFSFISISSIHVYKSLLTPKQILPFLPLLSQNT